MANLNGLATPLLEVATPLLVSPSMAGSNGMATPLLEVALESDESPALVSNSCCMPGCNRDSLTLFATRTTRMFAYGGIAPVFFLYMISLGFSTSRTGILMTSILLGDLVITLFLTTRADRFLGRRRVMIVGALGKVLAGVVFATTSNFWGLLVAGTIGVISTSGGEIGPFIAVEQAAITQVVEIPGSTSGAAATQVATLFAIYNALGYAAQALGALVAGLVVALLQSSEVGWTDRESYATVFYAYGVVGALNAILYATLSNAVEPPPRPATTSSVEKGTAGDVAAAHGGGCTGWFTTFFGLRRPESAYIVLRMSLLFAMDSFAGAFVQQTWMSYWFNAKYGMSLAVIGAVLSAASIVSGLSGIVAARLISAIGAINTMVFTHLPSNVLLGLVPLMPNGGSAAGMLIARFCISQMDVPARQTYVAVVVAADERSAAGGITNIVRSLGMSVAPTLVGFLSEQGVHTVWFNSPWFIAGGIKIIYDLILYISYNCGKGLKAAETSGLKNNALEHVKRQKLAADQAGVLPSSTASVSINSSTPDGLAVKSA